MEKTGSGKVSGRGFTANGCNLRATLEEGCGYDGRTQSSKGSSLRSIASSLSSHALSRSFLFQVFHEPAAMLLSFFLAFLNSLNMLLWANKLPPVLRPNHVCKVVAPSTAAVVLATISAVMGSNQGQAVFQNKWQSLGSVRGGHTSTRNCHFYSERALGAWPLQAVNPDLQVKNASGASKRNLRPNPNPNPKARQVGRIRSGVVGSGVPRH